MQPVTRLATVLVATACVALGVGGCSGSSGSDASPAASSSASVAPSTSAPTESGSASAASETSSGTASTPAPSASDIPTVELSVEGSTVTGTSRIQVSPGQEIRVIVTADRSSELHVHAADPEIETETVKGQPVTVQFTAPEQQGIYEIEMHDPDLLLLEVEVQ